MLMDDRAHVHHGHRRQVYQIQLQHAQQHSGAGGFKSSCTHMIEGVLCGLVCRVGCGFSCGFGVGFGFGVGLGLGLGFG